MSDLFARTGAEERIVVSWATATGTYDLKAAVTQDGKARQIRVLGGLVFAGASGGTIKFVSHGAETDTDLTGAMVLGANAKLFDRVEAAGHCETKKGEGLRVVVSGSSGAFTGVLLIQVI